MFGSRILAAVAVTLTWTGMAHAGGFEVPEPASIVLLTIGAAGAVWWSRRRR
jgi:hypothetical protein